MPSAFLHTCCSVRPADPRHQRDDQSCLICLHAISLFPRTCCSVRSRHRNQRHQRDDQSRLICLHAISLGARTGVLVAHVRVSRGGAQASPDQINMAQFFVQVIIVVQIIRSGMSFGGFFLYIHEDDWHTWACWACTQRDILRQQLFSHSLSLSPAPSELLRQSRDCARPPPPSRTRPVLAAAVAHSVRPLADGHDKTVPTLSIRLHAGTFAGWPAAPKR